MADGTRRTRQTEDQIQVLTNRTPYGKIRRIRLLDSVSPQRKKRDRVNLLYPTLISFQQVFVFQSV